VRAGAGLFRRCGRGVLSVRGTDRVRWLDGMLTNEIAALAVGPERSGCYALLLTRQGRIVADLHVLQRGDALWLEADAAALAAARETLAKLIVADDVALEDASADFDRLAVEGPTASKAIARVAGRLPALGAHAACDVSIGGHAVVLGAWGESGESALQLFAPTGSGDAIAALLRDAGAPLGLVEARAEVLEILRVEAGTPRFGCELTPDVLPAEARLEAAISRTKGCYTGQEVVERMRSRGQLSHRLVGIAFDAEVAREELPPRGSAIEIGDELAGEITSAVRSQLVGPIALGYVRRAQAEVGTALRVGELAGEIAELPFVRPSAPRG
jgi:aminomethyltransferase